jgi:hypothetical protein
VDVTRSGSGDVAASNRVSVATPDGRETTSVNVYVGMDQERWESDGYQDCVLSLDF